MTTSNLEHNETLAYFGFRQKFIEKSMIIIEENSSEYSSPKKFITASGFYSNNASQRDLLRPESYLGIGGTNRVERDSFECLNRGQFTPTKFYQSFILESPEVIHPQPFQRKITFNYISPGPIINKNAIKLNRQQSNLSLKSE